MKQFLCAFLLFGLPSFATISQRQNPVSQWNGSASSTCSTTLPGSGYHSGDLIVVWTYWNTGSSSNNLTASVSDNPYGNIYMSAVGPTLQSASNTAAQIFYARSTNSGTGGDVITVQYSGSATTSGCVFVEYQGADPNYPLDSASAGYGYSVSGLLDSGNAAPANANLLVFGGGNTDFTSSLPSAGTGFTNVLSSFGNITEQMIVSGNNTLQRASASTTGTGNWLMQMAVFRDASWTVGGGWNPARPAQIQYADQFPGADACAKITAAWNSLGSAGGIVDGRGFIGNQACSAANANALIPSSAQGKLLLGAVNLQVPLSISSAHSGDTPALGTIVIPSKVQIEGNGIPGVIGGNNNTTITATSNSTHEFGVSSISITYAGGTAYMALNASGMDLVGRERIKVTGSSVAANNGSWTICDINTVGRNDANCPANPISSTVYVPVSSGIVNTTISGNGGYGSNPSCAFGAPTAGGVQATCVALETGGTVAIQIVNPGTNYQSAPSCTLTGGGGSATCTAVIETGGTGATLHAEIPLIEFGGTSGTATFGQQLKNLTLNCSQLADCVGMRALTAQEQFKVEDVFITGVINRGFDLHTFGNQNGDGLIGVRVTPGTSPNCDVGTEAGYIGDGGPHNVEKFTADFTNCANTVNTGIDYSADQYGVGLNEIHCDGCLFSVLLGDASGARGVHGNGIWGHQGTMGIAGTMGGAYQLENPATVEVRSEFFGSTPGTTDYTFDMIARNGPGANAYSVSDNNPVNQAATDGYHIQDPYTSFYSVDAGSGSCVAAINTSSRAPFLGCGLNTSSLAFSGSTPAVTTSGTTPYLNMNTLVKGAKNGCTFSFTTSTFTTALSPVTLCTWTLPNAALSWYWSCTTLWSNPAGTTPKLSFGENFAQAPSAASAMAEILTANTGTGTQGGNLTAASGATNILTSGTLTNSATLFQANASGTFTASATSGTLKITASLTGTGATGTLNGGCTIQ